jgi:hypothetical protein
MQQLARAPVPHAAVHHRPVLLKPPTVVKHRPARVCKAASSNGHNQDGSEHAHASSSGSSLSGSDLSDPAAAAAAAAAAGTASGSDASTPRDQPAGPAPSQPPQTVISTPSRPAQPNSRSMVQSFPPKRPQQQRKQLDVNRAVRLLKLTAWRSDNKSTSKLPPWFMRIRDDFQETAGSAWSVDPTSSTSSNSSSGTQHSGTSTSSSTGKLLAAIDTLDDVIADELSSQHESEADSSRGGAMGSRWRSGSPAGADAGGRAGRRGRMWSASDPIRRPWSRQDDACLLPWQVSMLSVSSCGQGLLRDVLEGGGVRQVSGTRLHALAPKLHRQGKSD